MVTNPADVSAVSSPASTTNTSATQSGADLLAEMRAFGGELDRGEASAPAPQSKRKAAPETETAAEAEPSVDDEAKDVAGPTETETEKSDAEDSSSDTGPAKTVSREEMKRRVSKVAAQFHAQRERADKAEMQVERLHKAIELLKDENARFAPKVSTDPRDERIRQYELERQVEKFNSELEQNWAARRQQYEEQQKVDERAQALVSEVKSAAAQYGVDARHVLQVLQVSSDSAEEIAKRLAAANGTPKVTPKPAPKAVGTSGKTAGNSYLIEDRPTKETMADFLRSLEG